MQYLRGSHRRFYTYDRMYGPGSRYERDFQRRPPRPEDVVDVVGPAGTVAVFDTNGLHSGNRNGGARRDTLIFYYSARALLPAAHLPARPGGRAAHTLAPRGHRQPGSLACLTLRPGATVRPLLHVGYAKAGSTWLQRHVFDNADVGFVLADRREAVERHLPPSPSGVRRSRADGEGSPLER